MVIGRRRVISGLIDGAIATAITTTITLVCSSLLLMLLFRVWITRHLEKMAAYAAAMSFENLDRELVLQGRTAQRAPDEIDQLVFAFNAMRDTLRNEIGLRDRYAAELVAHRERLEELVAERTSALEQKTQELQHQKDEMQRLAHTDSLTGVPNRRRFRELAEQEMARCRRYGRPLSVLMLDIDHFKLINDTWGHDVGDRAIRALCAECLRQLRPGDAIGRWGGEEFAILLPETDSTNARAVAERIRAAISAIRVQLGADDSVAFTASIGVATLEAEQSSIDAVLKGADKALYLAKQAGRDRVVVNA